MVTSTMIQRGAGDRTMSAASRSMHQPLPFQVEMCVPDVSSGAGEDVLVQIDASGQPHDMQMAADNGLALHMMDGGTHTVLSGIPEQWYSIGLAPMWSMSDYVCAGSWYRCVTSPTPFMDTPLYGQHVNILSPLRIVDIYFSSPPPYSCRPAPNRPQRPPLMLTEQGLLMISRTSQVIAIYRLKPASPSPPSSTAQKQALSITRLPPPISKP